MPEVVQSFVLNHDYIECRNIQERLIEAYEQDFAKHGRNDKVSKIRLIWNSIPLQLAKENNKFVYGLVRDGARAKEYENAIMWLSDCGFIYLITGVLKPGISLKAYEDPKASKIYLLYVGILCCLANISHETIVNGNSLFVEFKGALREQYACEQLKTKDNLKICYYANDRGT